MDCSSPMSAKTFSNTAISDASSAGIKRPNCVIKVKSPTVLILTVLPPVFGPVTISEVKSIPKFMSIGTAVFLSKKGW